MIRYRYDYDTATVVAVECEKRGEGTDAHGRKQFLNTHFDTEREAWNQLVVEVEAGLSLGARARERTRDALAKITAELADDAERLVKAKAGLRKATEAA